MPGMIINGGFTSGSSGMGIKVRVHLHTILQRETPQGTISQLELELPDGSTIKDLLSQLDIEMAPDSLLLAANGRTATLDRTLVSGDEVHLMPAISGG